MNAYDTSKPTSAPSASSASVSTRAPTAHPTRESVMHRRLAAARRPRYIYAGFPWRERDCGQGALRAPAGYVCPCRTIILTEID